MPRPLALMFAVAAGGLTSFYLLVSVVPLYAATAGAGETGAGLVTSALMATTVLGELVTPRLVRRYGYPLVLGAGLVLLGALAFVLAGVSGLPATVAVCLLRGLGLGILVTAGGALTALLVPAERRGEGLGLSGVVVNVPAVAALPLGVWLVERVGYPVVFTAGGVAALVVLVALAGLPRRQAAPARWLAGPAAVLAGAVLFGAGFGITQNVTLTLMLGRVQPSSYPTVSAQWNLAYDGGWGLGAVGFGLIVGATGYPIAFGLTAAIVLAATVPALLDRRI